MENTLNDIKLILLVIMACLVVQTIGIYFGNADRVNAAGSIQDVNIAMVAGSPVSSPYTKPIKVRVSK